MNFLREAVWVMVKRGTPLRSRLRIASLLLEGLFMLAFLIVIGFGIITVYVYVIRWFLQFFA